MTARIYQRPKSAMQSGKARVDEWVLEFEQSEARRADPLMGWTGSGDTQVQVQLSMEAVVEAGREAGMEYAVCVKATARDGEDAACASCSRSRSRREPSSAARAPIMAATAEAPTKADCAKLLPALPPFFFITFVCANASKSSSTRSRAASTLSPAAMRGVEKRSGAMGRSASEDAAVNTMMSMGA